MTESPENPASEQRDGPAGEPDALKPDEPTAVQSVAAPAGAAPPARGPAVSEPTPPVAGPVPPAPAWTPPAADAAPSSSPAAAVADRPEIAVGAAFAGGLVLALILKRLAR